MGVRSHVRVGGRDSKLTAGSAAARAVAAFVASVLVFHHLPALAGATAGDAVDLATPFAVVGSAALALARLPASRAAIALGLVAALLYVDGHGIHLAANSIHHEPLVGDAETVAHFWDERFGHSEWHLGWFGLVGVLCLADRGARTRVGRGLGAGVALVLGFTLFTSTVEGGTWWLELVAAAGFAVWAARDRRPLLTAFAAAFALAALLIGVWAAWHGGSVPEFSDVGWL